MTESSERPRPARDRPWLMRTYAGHTSATESNALYRRNIAKGQTGLSVAFDLPTQTGYDADHILARGEVGRVGVPAGGQQNGAAVELETPSHPRAEASCGQHGRQGCCRVVGVVTMPQCVPLAAADDRAERVVLQEQHPAGGDPSCSLG